MNPTDTITLAALQIEPAHNLNDTFIQVKKLTTEITSQHEDLGCLVLPEYAFGTFREWLEAKYDSEDTLGQIQGALTDLCKQFQVPMIAGTIPYKTEKEQWRNRSYLFSSKGEMLGSYDKQHPFRAEKLIGLEPGTVTPIFNLGQLRMAILICSDLWFHDLLEEIAQKVDFIAVPTMTTVLEQEHIQYGQWAWQSLVAVRAKEYILPIVSADQASREYAPGVFTCGGSCIADPSYRFTNTEGPHTQALKVPSSSGPSFVVNTISLQKVRKYLEYRQDVGLKEGK